MNNLFMAFLLVFNEGKKGKNMDKFSLWIPDIRDGGIIPKMHVCNGEGVSPEVHFENIPDGTKSIALVMEDINDFPSVHWLVYDIPPSDIVPRGLSHKLRVSSICQGKNDFGILGYTPPCPPSGTHSYVFRAYALDITFKCDSNVTHRRLLDTMKGHVLAEDSLTGVCWIEEHTRPCVRKPSIWQKILDFIDEL